MRKRQRKAIARALFRAKLKALAHYIIWQHGDDGLEEAKLWWIVWLADMESYRQRRVSITGARWRKGREFPEPEFHWLTWRDNERRRGWSTPKKLGGSRWVASAFDDIEQEGA